MSTEIAKVGKNSALTQLASRLNVPAEVMKDTLKATAFKECKSDAEFLAAVIVANTYRLNPLLKEMYAFPAKGGGIIPIVSIDGFISLANRHPDFNGVELIENEEAGQPGGLKSVTAKFYLKGKDHPIVVTEYMAECYNDTKEPWKKWPRRMLRHKAYIQGARVAFGFSGIYDPDEGERIVEAEAAPASGGKPHVSMPQERVQASDAVVYGDIITLAQAELNTVHNVSAYLVSVSHRQFPQKNDKTKMTDVTFYVVGDLPKEPTARLTIKAFGTPIEAAAGDQIIFNEVKVGDFNGAKEYMTKEAFKMAKEATNV